MKHGPDTTLDLLLLHTKYVSLNRLLIIKILPPILRKTTYRF